MEVVRHKGAWYRIIRKPYEPERQSYKIAWSMIREPEIYPEVAYKRYFENMRNDVKVLYPSFRKENDT